ncbi:hypothetical protein N9B48_00960 [bacterium]|jgi:hypothetical protein|nr:hypothetical protein [bacterium]
MQKYLVNFVDKQGKSSQQLLEAESESEVLRKAKSLGLYVTGCQRFKEPVPTKAEPLQKPKPITSAKSSPAVTFAAMLIASILACLFVSLVMFIYSEGARKEAESIGERNNELIRMMGGR